MSLKKQSDVDPNLIDNTDPALQLDNILTNILSKFFIVDSKYRIVRTNIKIAEDGDKSLSSIIGRKVCSVFPITGPEIEKSARKVFKTRETVCIELEMDALQRGTVMKREKMDQLLYVDQRIVVGYELATYYPLSASDGQIKFVLVTIQDITQRKKAVVAQLQEKQMMTKVVENLPNEYFMVDVEGRFHRWNKRFEEVLGHTTREVSKLKLSDVFIDQKEHMFWESFDSNSKQKIKPIQCKLRKKDGSDLNRFIIGSVEPINNVPFMVCMGVDAEYVSYKRGSNIKTWSEVDGMISQLEMDNIYLREEIDLEFQHSEIVGKTQSIKTVLQQVESVSKTDSSVLLLGETGTGKELIARSIHALSLRKERPMVKVNCAAFPPDLIEDELFGHEKGAYTGAQSRRPGRFEVADRSTLFLDEIGEMPLNLQSKLLRILQEGEFERLGGTQTLKVDVRIIAATNKDLELAVKEGLFRQDLYYRLNIFPISVPPLRERKEDIPFLAERFIKDCAEKIGKKINHIPKKTISSLQQYSWPGNIRELRNIIERAIILSRGSILHIDLPKSAYLEVEKIMTLDEVQKQYIESILKQTGGKIRGTDGAAVILGMKPTTLESRMKKFGIV